jgi:DegV family protein with EDD domain
LSEAKMKIVIDSAGDMPEGWAQDYGIDVIPINIHFGENMYLQGVDMSDGEFYEKAVNSSVFPKTSQPSPAQFVQFYRKIAQAGETILSLHVTAKLSGTFASAQMAAKELMGELNVLPVDSASGSAAMGFMAREARLMERAGATIEDIQHRMEWIANQVQITLTLNTLEFARRSGRVKALQAAIASLLNVKPVLFLKKGELEMGERVRTRNRAIEFVVKEMAKRLGGRKVNAAVVHAEDPEGAKSMFDLARQMLNYRELVMTRLSIGIAANLGPGTIGLAAYPLEEA